MSMSAAEFKWVIAVFICICIIPVIITFIAFIVLCIDILCDPNIYIQDLYVPGLNKTTSFNASVFVDFKFERAVTLTRPSYEDFQMTMFYGERNSSLGTHMVPGFHMGRKRRVFVKAAIEAVGMPWQEATSGRNVAAMVVELVVNERIRDKRVVVRAHVWVDASGHMVSINPIKLIF